MTVDFCPQIRHASDYLTGSLCLHGVEAECGWLNYVGGSSISSKLSNTTKIGQENDKPRGEATKNINSSVDHSNNRVLRHYIPKMHSSSKICISCFVILLYRRLTPTLISAFHLECRGRASEREKEGGKEEECSREGDVESREQRRENSRQQQKKKKYKCFVEWFYLRELTRFNVIKVVSLGRTSFVCGRRPVTSVLAST
ncbi:hypothetical protein T03_10646 [Trichinella britovi]|uniref:Uncharacterized protein n=1 Tax=Trichinella britovi TaxID=45882 RepID=A0A0V1D003_TRIBR|nr:hypothetical protein T03_10646 [Trichinella britovi]